MNYENKSGPELWLELKDELQTLTNLIDANDACQETPMRDKIDSVIPVIDRITDIQEYMEWTTGFGREEPRVYRFPHENRPADPRGHGWE